MKKNLIFLLVAAVVFAISFPTWTISQQPPGLQNAWNPPATLATSSSNETMIVTSIRAANGNTQMVLVDSQRRTIVVYEVTADTGAIQLKSVRNMNADFMLDEFNGTDPTPEKVRGILANP